MLLDHHLHDRVASIPERLIKKIVPTLKPILLTYPDSEVIVQCFAGKMLNVALIDVTTQKLTEFPLTSKMGTHGLLSVISGELNVLTPDSNSILVPGLSKLVEMSTCSVAALPPCTRFSVVYWSLDEAGEFRDLTLRNINRISVLTAEDQRVLTSNRNIPHIESEMLQEWLFRSIVYRSFEQFEDQQLQMDNLDYLSREAFMLRRQYDLHFGQPKILRAYLKINKIQKVANRFFLLFNIKPQQYLIRKRHDHAKMLLINTSLSIQEIAWEVGFDSGASFNRRFTKDWRMSPTQFRIHYKNANQNFFLHEAPHKTNPHMPHLSRM